MYKINKLDSPSQIERGDDRLANCDLQSAKKEREEKKINLL